MQSSTSFDILLKDLEAAVPFPQFVDQSTAQYRTIFEDIMPLIPERARILDFGAGLCDKSVFLSLAGHQCDAVDDLENPGHTPQIRDMIRSLCSRNGVSFSEYLPDNGSASYDLVLMFNVLPHIHNSPAPLLFDLVDRIKPGGFLAISVANIVNIRKRISVLAGRTNLAPFAMYWNSGTRWRGAHREYDRRDLIYLSKALGLDIVSLRGEHHMTNRLSPYWSRLFRIASMPFPGWRDTWVLIARKGK